MKCKVNGEEIEIPEAQRDRKLVDFLREELDLTGTKVGCGIGMCGSCTVLVDGQAKRACLITLGTVAGKTVMTIEGLSPREGPLHPVQQAFLDAGAIQCGFCTPGMVLTTVALLRHSPRPTRAQVRQALRGNLCRCTGYQQIVDAVMEAARMLAPERGELDKEERNGERRDETDGGDRREADRVVREGLSADLGEVSGGDRGGVAGRRGPPDPASQGPEPPVL